MSKIEELLNIVTAALEGIRGAVNTKAEDQGVEGYIKLEDWDFERIPEAIDMLYSPLAKSFQGIGYEGIPKILIDGIALSERIVDEWSSWSKENPYITTEAEKALITSEEYINMPYIPQVYVGGDLDTSNLFNGCSKAFAVRDIKVVKSGESLFEGCANLRSIRSIEVAREEKEEENVTSLRNMFKGCTILQSIPNIDEWYVDNVTSLSGTFSNCKNLRSLEISGWHVSNVKDFSSCFQGCVLKDHLNLSSWDVANATNVANMFESCTCSSLTIGEWDLSQVTDASRMFWWCTLKNIDLTTVIWKENVNLSNFLNYSSLVSLVGNRTLEAVGERGSNDCIKLFEGVKKSIDLQTTYTSINAATLQAIYNGIAKVSESVTDDSPQIIVKKNHYTPPTVDYATKLNNIGWTLNVVE